MTTVRFTVECIDADRCTVYFEPEGGWVELQRGEMITVEMRGRGDAVPEIAYMSDGIMVCAWGGALAEAWDSQGVRLDI